MAGALPQLLRGNVIICGSLAAAYHFFSGDGAASLRTKDVDMLLSPHAVAVATAVEVTEQLLAANWKQREDAKFGTGGRPEDDIKDLPVVRLRPQPGVGAQAQWFLELLSAPPRYETGAQEKTNQRVHTRAGHFTIPSFAYLALAEWKPIKTPHGVLIARPEMMALANMLHHPFIRDDLMRDAGDWKRSNKDLCRVLAMAHLTLERDRREGTDEFDQWAQRMWDAPQEKFGEDAHKLAMGADTGIDALLASRGDLAQALRIANLGLLASLDETSMTRFDRTELATSIARSSRVYSSMTISHSMLAVLAVVAKTKSYAQTTWALKGACILGPLAAMRRQSLRDCGPAVQRRYGFWPKNSSYLSQRSAGLDATWPATCVNSDARM